MYTGFSSIQPEREGEIWSTSEVAQELPQLVVVMATWATDAGA